MAAFGVLVFIAAYFAGVVDFEKGLIGYGKVKGLRKEIIIFETEKEIQEVANENI